jgi:hypothetical protein
MAWGRVHATIRASSHQRSSALPSRDPTLKPMTWNRRRGGVRWYPALGLTWRESCNRHR